MQRCHLWTVKRKVILLLWRKNQTFSWAKLPRDMQVRYTCQNMPGVRYKYRISETGKMRMRGRVRERQACVVCDKEKLGELCLVIQVEDESQMYDTHLDSAVSCRRKLEVDPLLMLTGRPIITKTATTASPLANFRFSQSDCRSSVRFHDINELIRSGTAGSTLQKKRGALPRIDERLNDITLQEIAHTHTMII